MRKGFTLIEVLITIAIMGILSTIGISTYQSTQKKGRDFNRKASLTAVVKALENFMSDKGMYPASDTNGTILWCGTADDPEMKSCSWGVSFTDVASTADEKTVYMASLPEDPIVAHQYFYQGVEMDGAVKGYRLYGRLENSNDPEISGPYGTLEDGVTCKTGEGDTTCNYVVTSGAVPSPQTCFTSGSGCGGPTSTSCCSPYSCSAFYTYTFFSGYTDHCTEHYFCGNPNSLTYTPTKGSDNGVICDNWKQCCSKECNTFYSASCVEGKFCGTTPPSGYYSQRRKNDGQGCSAPTDCCSGVCNTYFATGSCNPTLLCGSTPPSGYGTTPNCCLADGTACTASSDCCNGSCTTFYQDADHDGYGNASVSTRRCGTSYSGYVANNTDCNDTGTNSVNVYISATCYVDSDNDNYGSVTAKSCTNNAACGSATWASAGEGTAASSGNFASNNTDCNDSNASCFAMVTCYPNTDADGDGYTVNAGETSVCSSSSCPSSCSSYSVPSSTIRDCYDNNAQAKPGQTSFFDVNRGDGSFDYNCDTVEEKRWGFSSIVCSDHAICIKKGSPGFVSIPSCGMSAKFVVGCHDCGWIISNIQQQCR